MTPNALLTRPESGWQGSLRRAARSMDQILEYTGIPRTSVSGLDRSDFPAFATLEYLDRVERGNAADPLLLQVLPLEQERAPSQWSLDPVGDRNSEVVPGLLHKYAGRMLMVLTGACAVHCRYCFRQHFPYSEIPKSVKEWEGALDHIRREPSIQEVLLSGGDPLMIVDEKLEWLVEQLDGIPHLRRLRIHTRLPIMIPWRVQETMLRWLQSTRLSKWIVLHVNHPHEIDEAVTLAIERLKHAGCQLLNQSVLLQGINDDVTTLVRLSERLLDVGVMPYYLHQLDPVRGAAHFEVDENRGRHLVEEMRRMLPGYGVPLYVREIAGQPHKTPLT